MKDIILQFFFSVLGVFAALIVDREKYPRIKISAKEEANSDNTYSSGAHIGERWKFFRIAVSNEKLPTWIDWLIVRQTAENCRAEIRIKGMNNGVNYSYKGRWASTPEIPFLDQNSALLKIAYNPDPVIIEEGKEEILDIFTKNERDKEAYGWNNESYFHDWRNKSYVLNPGLYFVRVIVIPQNGISASQEFMLTVGEKIEETKLVNK